MLNYITLFDTSVATDNAGDEIIMDALTREIHDLFPNDFYARIPTHDELGSVGRAHAQRANFAFVGGTNLLCPHWFVTNQWRIGKKDFWRIGHPLLVGVGWHKYERTTDIFTAWLLRFVLKNKYIHSVRDSYTKMRLDQAGVKNVLNTGCITMWRLTPAHCAQVEKKKSNSAVITVTCYSPSPEDDRRWIELVLSQYEKVYFWPQMYADEAYMESLGLMDKLIPVGANLKSYDELLDQKDVDFIGTRLHGGIRAIQKKRRSIILAVDNRAAEISKDTHLPCVQRKDVGALKQMITIDLTTDIRMNFDVIEEWKQQFKKV